MRGKFLGLSILAMAALASLALSTVFLGSLAPNTKSLERADESGRSVSLESLEVGSFLTRQDEFFRYFVLRDFEGAVRVYSVPYREGAFWIADLRWDRPFLPCIDFGPDSDGRMLVQGGAFRCRDDDLSEWWQRESVWDYSGRSLGVMSANMPETEYVLRGEFVILIDGNAPLYSVSSVDSR